MGFLLKLFALTRGSGGGAKRGKRFSWPVLLRRGVTLGFLGGSNVWLALGAIAILRRLFQIVGEGRGEVLLVERLAPGQGISIVDTAVQRRKAPRGKRR